MSIILSVHDLKDILNHDGREITLIDVRSEEAYKESHLPEALFLDFKKDLAGENSFFPDVEKLVNKLSNLGVPSDNAIVFYDQGNHRAASKAWFMLNYLGHDTVFILDGGFQAWTDAGNEVTAIIPKVQSTHYEAKLKSELILDIKAVKERFNEENSVLVDSRAYKRYTGEEEPKYKKAGHIPGARNFHAKLAFDESGQWKEREDLQSHFASLKNKDEIIVSCGSGNSACMNFVALKEAGYKDVKIYPGGFSEWIEDEDNEVATGDE